MGSLQPNRIEPAAQQRPLAYVVSMLHGADREVLAWCPTPEDIPGVVAAGVDAVCVNDVRTALARLRG
jgi:glycerophosphoryl diester phosphodiesterase